MPKLYWHPLKAKSMVEWNWLSVTMKVSSNSLSVNCVAGKVYYDMKHMRVETENNSKIALCRIEQVGITSRYSKIFEIAHLEP